MARIIIGTMFGSDATRKSNSKNNNIFPFINAVTSNRTKDASICYTLNLYNHYIVDPTFGNLKLELYNRLSDIQSVNNLKDFRSKNFSINFNMMVYQNLDGILTLMTNRAKVKYIEYLNEPASYQYDGTCIFGAPNYSGTNFNTFLSTRSHAVIWVSRNLCNYQNNYTDPNHIKSVDMLAGLCKMYNRLIRDTLRTLVINNTYPSINSNDTLIKFGMPLSPENYGFQYWNSYITNITNMNNIGIDGIVDHAPYHELNPNPFTNATDATPSTLITEFNNEVTGIYKYDTMIKGNYLINVVKTIPTNKELWITEWNTHADGVPHTKSGNTLLHAMFYWDFIMNSYDINAKANLNTANSKISTYLKTNVISMTNHFAYINDNGDQTNYAMFSIQNSPYKSAQYLMQQNMLPILRQEPNMKYIKSLNGGLIISPTTLNLSFRTFYKTPTNAPYCTSFNDNGKLLIYFNNKNNTDYSMDLNTILSNSGINSSVWNVSTHYIWGDQLYTSYGATTFMSDPVIYDGTNGNTVNSLKTIQKNDDLIYQFGGIVCGTPYGDLTNSITIKKYSVGYIEVNLFSTSNVSSSRIGKIEEKDKNGETKLSIYPNPNNTTIQNIDLYSDKENKGSIQVYDITGKLLMNNSIDLKIGNNTYSISIENLSKGTYIFKVSTDTDSYTEKIILQ